MKAPGMKAPGWKYIIMKLTINRKIVYLITVSIFTLILIVTGACMHVSTSTLTTAPTTALTSTTSIQNTTATITTLSTSLAQTTTATSMKTSTTPTLTTRTTSSTTSRPGEVEATEFQGTQLTPISEQNNNALAGTQNIDEATYRLTVDGLVDHPLSLSYADLQAYPQLSRLMDLDCVEGWNFTAKWTGPSLSAIFAAAGVKSEAKIAIFYTADVPAGYTSLDLSYITGNNIIIALKDNDITLPSDRGFPFQVVAMGKFGYKWAKWVTRIELSSNTNFRGFWESNGYNNDADINGPAFQ
jgi:DMSO/TMAO reductase YedYZ molybdopterin-dependent catalytic subunit